MSRGARFQHRPQGQAAEQQGEDCEEGAGDLKAVGILDEAAHDQAEAGAGDGEKENQAHDAHAILGGSGDLGHEGFQSAAGHGGRGEEQLQHEDEVQNVPPAAALGR